MKKTTKPPVETMFPTYVEEWDKFAMTAMCATELSNWRFEVAKHRGLPTIEKKLNHRKTLEASYDALEAAWAMANEVVEVEPVLMAA